MITRRSVALVLIGALASMGANYRTQNFDVTAPTPEIAQQVGQYAEHYRREKALQWIGQAMPDWGAPCPLVVTVTMNGAGGATSFAFDRGRILSMDMHIEGPLDRLLASVLPHEVTHTVFAYYYRTPVPRWADEGGSVLSEDNQERSRHDLLVRQILNTPGRAIPLRRLFALRDYPRDVMVLYAEGYSVTNFLVSQSNRSEFLAFVAQGMRGDWDGAVRSHYRYNSVEEMEQAWVQSLRDNRPRGDVLARGNAPSTTVVVRQTAPPYDDKPRPVFRGQMQDEAPYGYLPEYSRTPVMPTSNQQYAPPPPPAFPAPASSGSPYRYEQPYSPAQVQLGAPVSFSQPVPAGPSR